MEKDLNPFKTDLILAHFFKYLNNTDLITSRLVSAQWNHESTKILRKRIKINLSGSNSRAVTKFIETMKPVENDSTKFPYSQFIISIWDPMERRDYICHHEDYQETIPLYTSQFFETCGTHIRYLQLSMVDFEKTIEIPTYCKWLVSSLPNLQVLVLVGQASCGLLNKAPNNELAKLLMEEEIRFPNLQSLTLKDLFGECDQLPKHNDPSVDDLSKCARFNELFLSDVFSICARISSLTIDTLECKNKCSLTQASIHVLSRVNLRRLEAINLSTLIDEEQLVKTICQNSNFLQLKSLHIKFIQISPFSTLNEIGRLERFIKSKCKMMEKLRVDEMLNK